MKKYLMKERIIIAKMFRGDGIINLGDRKFEYKNGDMHVQYGDKEWVVDKEIFNKTYKLINNPDLKYDTYLEQSWAYKSLPVYKIISEPAEIEFEINTLEGMQKVSIGDRIVVGVQGECYPISNEYFLASYVEVKNTNE